MAPHSPLALALWFPVESPISQVKVLATMLEELYVETRMNVHRGIEFTVTRTKTAGVWRWQFRIVEEAKTGQTRAKLRLLAIRRVQTIIDRELRKRTAKTSIGSGQGKATKSRDQSIGASVRIATMRVPEAERESPV